MLIFIFQGSTRGKKYPSLYLPLSEGFDNHKIKKILFFYDFLKFFENAMLFLLTAACEIPRIFAVSRSVISS